MGVKKIAVIGAGGMAREHIRAAAAVPGAEICGIYSRTKEKAENLAKEFGIGYVADSLADLYRTTQAGYVIITVSVADVAQIIEKCAEYGWQILAEKPAALNHREVVKLEQQLGAKSKNVFVALNRRTYSSAQNALIEVEKSPTRRIVEISDQQSYTTALALGHPLQVVDNWMYANSIHLIDMANFFCRGSVAAVKVIKPWHGVETDFVLSHITYESGDEALYRCYLKQPGPWAIVISNEENRLEMRPMEKLFVQRKGERALTEVPAAPFDADYKPGFVLQLSNFLTGQGVTLAQANKTMQLIEKIYGV